MLVLTLLGLECFDSLGSFRFPNDTFHVYYLSPAFYTSEGKTYLYFFIPGPPNDTMESIVVMDISDPAKPEMLSRIFVEDTNGPYDLGFYDSFSIDSFLYFLGSEGGYFRLFVFSLEPDPTHPKLVRTVPSKVKLPAKSPPKSFGHDNPWEYVPEENLLYYIENYYDYVFVYDVSDPSNPQFLGYSNFATGPNDWHAMLIRYPYLYIARTFEVDTYAFSTHLEVYKISNKVNFTLIGSTKKLGGTTDYKGLGFIASKDSSRKFVLVPGMGHPNAVDVTDPYNPQWVDVEDADRVILDGKYYTSTPDDRRVYITSSSRIAVAEADPTPRVVCVDTVGTVPGADWASFKLTLWYKGKIYSKIAQWYTGDSTSFDVFFLVLHYPEDDTPELSDSSKLRAPTFQTSPLLKLISPREGWFDLKLFSSTGALVERRRVYLRKGVNLVDIDRVEASGVYFLEAGEETKPLKLTRPTSRLT